jgi:hypothetical protein
VETSPLGTERLELGAETAGERSVVKPTGDFGVGRRLER